MKDQDKLLQAAQRIFDGDSADALDFNESKANRAHQALLKVRGLMQSFNASQTEDLDLADQNWDRLQVKDLIGQGGMGSVYRAYDPILNRHVALKVLNSRAAQFIDAEQFVQEAQRMAQVRHPHIMAVYGAGKDGDISAYWGELLQGPQLNTYLKEQAVGSDRRLELAIQLSEAVQAIHKKQLVHADIKNANVIIEQERGAVLMDFGASLDLQINDPQLFQPSTPLAMAPEQFAGQGPTQATDVFSLGVVYYHLFCGVYPFPGDDFESLRDHVLNAQFQGFKSGSNINKKLQRLIQRMLSHDAKNRPSIHAVRATLLDVQRLPLQRAKRNALVLGGLLLMSITLASLYSAYKTQQTNAEILKAQTETEAVNTVMEQILRSPATNEKGKDIRMLDVVKGAVSKINDNQTIPPTAKGRLQYALAHALTTLGESESAQTVFSEIVETEGVLPFTKKSALIQLATRSIDTRKFDQGELYLTKAEQVNRFETDWLLSEARLMASYANLYQKQQAFEKSLEYSQHSIDLWEELGDHKDKTYVLILQGKNYMYLSQHADAEKVFLEAHQHSVKHVGERNINSIVAQMGAASMMSSQGKLEESRTIYEDLIPLVRDFLGEKNVFYYAARFNFATLLTESGQYEEALAQQLDLLAQGTEAGGTEVGVAELKGAVANQYTRLERYDQAETMYKTAIEELSDLVTPEHRLVYKFSADYASMLNTTERSEEAMDILLGIEAGAHKILGEDHDTVLHIKHELAWAHFKSGEIDTAQQNMEVVLQLFEKKYGLSHQKSQGVLQRMQEIKAIQ